ncbi:VanZ family protein [Streptomyces avicenniae]|uniref:VanZ family protein n=1 Tax=Streptomyces avicenniae TaxID=500153 RepID=UPI000ABD0099|nr:VanZ family protein [Streptomyces avicenniae]
MAIVERFRPHRRTKAPEPVGAPSDTLTDTPADTRPYVHDGADLGGPAPDEAPVAPRPPLFARHTWRAALARVLILASALVLMVAFAVALARVTLVPSPDSAALIHTNLRPGASIGTYLDQPDWSDTVQQIGGNVLLGVPFGVLLPVLFPRIRGLLRVALFTALVMVMVETAQGLIVEGRAFDIDDVILNTTGALIGCLIVGRRLSRALYPRRPHWWHRWTRRGPVEQPVVDGR